jgi:hypothetical protein
MHFPCSAEAFKAQPKKGVPSWAIALMILGALGMCGIFAAAGKKEGASSTPSDSRPSESRPSESRPAAPQPKETGPDKTVTIGEILKAYKGNEISADGAYKGKRVRITGGIVDDIKKDILGDPYITVGTGAQFEIPQVQCSLAGNQVSKAAGLNKGDRVTVTGEVSGLMMNVQMSDCSF